MAKVAAVEKPLRDKLGEEGSQSLINLINVSKDEQKQEMLTFVEEKFEHRLTTEVDKVNERMTEKIAGVKKDIGQLDTKIERMRADLIKWMFIFWIGQVGALLGILFAFFK